MFRQFFLFMKITSIQKQQKAKSRYNIYVDGEFAFGLYKDTITDYGLRVNDELNEMLLNEIKESDELIYGKKTAFEFLAYKARSKKEVYDKLKTRNISEKSIIKVLDYLEQLKYIDDETYIKTFLSGLSGKPSGRKMMLHKLLKKGINKELAERVLNDILNDKSDYDNGKKLLLKYVPKIKSKDFYEIKKKCFTYLMSRGFEYETVNLLLNSELDFMNESTERKQS